MKTNTTTIRAVLAFLLLATVVGCAATKAILRTVDDAGTLLCELFAQENPEQFAEHVRSVLPPGAPQLTEAERDGFVPGALCGLKEVVQPFLDDALRLQQAGPAGLRREVSE